MLGHILDKSIVISRPLLAASGLFLILGLLFAGGAQLGYYLSWDRYTQAHFGAARNAMGRFRGEPDGINAHDLRTSARQTRSFARYLMLISVALFGAGASVAVLAVVLALPQPASPTAQQDPAYQLHPQRRGGERLEGHHRSARRQERPLAWLRKADARQGR